MGTAALSERDYVHEAIDRADLILAAIGHDTIEKPPFIMGPNGPHGDSRLLHASQCRTGLLPAMSEVVGDVGLEPDANCWPTVSKAGCPTPRRTGCRCAKASCERTSPTALRKSRAWPLTPQRIVHDVRAVMPDDGIVALDNGMYKIWFARNATARAAPNTLLLDNALATMGAGLPSAMMAAMLFPEAARAWRSAATAAS